MSKTPQAPQPVNREQWPAYRKLFEAVRKLEVQEKEKAS